MKGFQTLHGTIFFPCLNKLPSDPSSAHLHLKQQRILILKGVSSSHQFGSIWNINLFVSEKDKGEDTAGSSEWVGRATRQAANRCYLWEQCQRMNAVHHVLLKVVLTTTFCNLPCAKLTPWLRTCSTSAVQKESKPPSLFFFLNVYAYIYIYKNIKDLHTLIHASLSLYISICVCVSIGIKYT